MPSWRQVGSKSRVGGYLGPLRGHLGRTFRPKVVLRASWTTLAPSWDRLGASWAPKTSQHKPVFVREREARYWCHTSRWPVCWSVFVWFLEHLGHVLGASWEVWEASWNVLGGAVRGVFGPSWGRWVAMSSFLARLGCALGASWRRLVAILARLGRVLGVSWRVLAHLGSWPRF